jgi:hypothetical protein
MLPFLWKSFLQIEVRSFIPSNAFLPSLQVLEGNIAVNQGSELQEEDLMAKLSSRSPQLLLAKR